MQSDNKDVVNDFARESNTSLLDLAQDIRECRAHLPKLNFAALERGHKSLNDIKGSAGCLGYDKIEKLAESVEIVLCMIADRDLKPTHGLLDGILDSTDVLMRLLSDLEYSNEADISQQVAGLARVAQDAISPLILAMLEKRVIIDLRVAGQEEEMTFETSEYLLKAHRDQGFNLFRIELDVLKQAKEYGKNLLDLVHEITSKGEILDSGVDVKGIGVLGEDFLPSSMPFYALLASKFEKEELMQYWGLPSDKVISLAYPRCG